MDGVGLCTAFAEIGKRIGKTFSQKMEEKAREKVKNLIYVVIKYVKHYKDKINLEATIELIKFCALEKKALSPESRFEIILILNSLDSLSEALNHTRALHVFQLLLLSSYEDPVIVYYCMEVISSLLAKTSPDLLINLWCLGPLIESMIQKLKEYSIDRVTHPLLETISVSFPL